MNRPATSTNQEKNQQDGLHGSLSVRSTKKKYHIADELERIHAKVMDSEDRMHDLQSQHKEMLRKLDATVANMKSLEAEKERYAVDFRARRKVLEERNQLATEALKVEYENLLQAKSQKWKCAPAEVKHSAKEIEQLKAKVT